MAVRPNNPNANPAGAFPLGRVIQTVNRYLLPSGRVRELREVVETFQDSQGIFRTGKYVEAVPPLDCGCVPEDMNDVAECARCGSVVCASKHSLTCPVCGIVHCLACTVTLEIEDGREIRLCKECAAEARTPTVIKVIRKAIWG